MAILEQESMIPGWTDINLIIKDLRAVLDSIDEKHKDARSIRAAIARTMAQMREEKILENQLNLARKLVNDLHKFKLLDAGVLEKLHRGKSKDLVEYKPW